MDDSVIRISFGSDKSHDEGNTFLRCKGDIISRKIQNEAVLAVAQSGDLVNIRSGWQWSPTPLVDMLAWKIREEGQNFILAFKHQASKKRWLFVNHVAPPLDDVRIQAIRNELTKNRRAKADDVGNKLTSAISNVYTLYKTEHPDFTSLHRTLDIKSKKTSLDVTEKAKLSVFRAMRNLKVDVRDKIKPPMIAALVRSRKELKRFDILRRDCDDPAIHVGEDDIADLQMRRDPFFNSMHMELDRRKSRLRSDAIGVLHAPMPEQARLTHYSVYVVGRILTMLNIKLEHVIDTGATFTIADIAEKADQLIIMCEKAAQLDGRGKVRSILHEDDKAYAAVVFIRSEFRQVGLRIDKTRKRNLDSANERYNIKLDDDVALMKDYVIFKH